MIDDIWNNDYNWFNKTLNKNITFSIKNNQLEFPKYIDSKKYNQDTFLTARTIKCLATQISGMIRAEIEKQRKRLYTLNKLKEENQPRCKRKALIKTIKQNIPVKPNYKHINPELNSICCDWLECNDGHFDGFLRLKSITKTKLDIKIPIKYHKHSRKLAKDREQLNSYLITKNYINIRWKKDISYKKDGETIGCDQGMKDVISCSNGFKPLNKCIHGHTLQSIITDMSRKKYGSKAFKRKQEHRKNFINWSINQIDFSNIKKVNFEEIININKGRRVNGLMRHWTNTDIRDKMNDVCIENGVHFEMQSSLFRSQRCSNCGLVRKVNRKGKIYECNHCGLLIDADMNASINVNNEYLPEVPWSFRVLNRGSGFFWKETGFYDLTGRSLTVPTSS